MAFDDVVEAAGGSAPAHRWRLDGDSDDDIGTQHGNSTSIDPTWSTGALIDPDGAGWGCGDYNGTNDETNLPDHTSMNTYPNPNGDLFAMLVFWNADTIDTSGNGRIIWEQGGGTNWITLYVIDNSTDDSCYLCCGEGGASGSVDSIRFTCSTGVTYMTLWTLDCPSGILRLHYAAEGDTTITTVSKTGGLNVGSNLNRHTADPSFGGPDGNPRNHAQASLTGHFDGRIQYAVYWDIDQTSVPTSTDAQEIWDACGLAPTPDVEAAPTLATLLGVGR